MKEYLLILWLGATGHGGPAMERFRTHDECERVATRALAWALMPERGITGPNHLCVEVEPFDRSPSQRE